MLGDYEIVVDTLATTTNTTNVNNSYWYPYSTGIASPSTFTYWTYPATVYKYQVKCPKASCKKNNWLELDKITPCVKCGSKLKAVSNQADFEIPIEE